MGGLCTFGEFGFLFAIGCGVDCGLLGGVVVHVCGI